MRQRRSSNGTALKIAHQPSDVERSWLAGLFEGEGCISLSRYKTMLKDNTRSKAVYPVVVIASTDNDVIRKFKRLVGFGRIHGPYWLKLSTKPQWHWRGSGWLVVNALWKLIGEHLGKRRKSRFREVLANEPAERPSAPNCNAPSYANYRRHINQGTRPCSACRQENSKAQRRRRGKKAGGQGISNLGGSAVSSASFGKGRKKNDEREDREARDRA
jgi:hypothetical protein